MTDATPTPPNPRLMKGLRIALLAILGLFALVILLVVMATCSVADKVEVVEVPSGPPLVAKADPSIRTVTQDTFHDGPRLVVDMKAEAWSDKDYLFNAGNVVKAVGHAMQAGAQDAGTAPKIALVVSTTGVDRLGAESEMVLMTLYFSRADLLAAHFDNLSVGRTLDLVTDIDFATAGAKAIVAYCLTERGRNQSEAFCTMAANKAAG